MHVAILIQDFPPETGAGPARITELARSWIANGHRVSVLTGLPNRRVPGQRDGVIPPEYRGRVYMEERVGGIEVHRSWLLTCERRGFATTLLNHLTFAASSLAAGLARLPRPDVIISSGPPYFSQFAGTLVARWRRIPLILEIRDLWPDYLAAMGTIKSPALLRAMFGSERWLVRQADEIVVVTESFRRRLIEKGARAEAVHVIPNGVDTTRYYPADGEAPDAAFTTPIGATEAPMLGYIGTFGAGQGLTAVLDAMRLLRRRGNAARLLLVGDGPERSLLEASLRDDPVDGVALRAPIPRDATRAFYNACAGIVVPHAALQVLGETVPSKIFEVMACGRPVVAALRGEGARIVDESGGGLLATPGDAPSIAEGIERLLALSDVERAAMGQAGRAYALANYDRAALADRYLGILERVVATRRTSSTTAPR